MYSGACWGVLSARLSRYLGTLAQTPGEARRRHDDWLLLAQAGMGVSIGGTPIAGWLNYDGKPHENGWWLVPPFFRYVRKPPHTFPTVWWGFLCGRGSSLSVCGVRFRYLWPFNLDSLCLWPNPNPRQHSYPFHSCQEPPQHLLVEYWNQSF